MISTRVNRDILKCHPGTSSTLTLSSFLILLSVFGPAFHLSAVNIVSESRLQSPYSLNVSDAKVDTRVLYLIHENFSLATIYLQYWICMLLNFLMFSLSKSGLECYTVSDVTYSVAGPFLCTANMLSSLELLVLTLTFHVSVTVNFRFDNSLCIMMIRDLQP